MLPSFSDSRHGLKRRRFDLALVLIGRAINNGNGVLLPLSVRAGSDEVAAVVRDLLAEGLIEEIFVTDTMQAWRVDGEVRYGLRVTQRGLRFVGYPPLESGLVEEVASGNVA